MARSITLQKRSTVVDTRTGNMLLVIEATASEDMPKEVFVNQRLVQADNKFEDVFAAVATPVQLEDFATLCPNAGTHYFRKEKVELVCFSAEYAQEVWETIEAEVAMLVQDLNDMDELSEAQTVVIS